MSGAALGSSTLEFAPGPVKAGEYQFSVGSAGIATLVFQTVLPALMRVSGGSQLTLRGGTHNAMAPPFHFIARSFAPPVAAMGVGIDLTLNRHGFYPAGGGEFNAHITPSVALLPLRLNTRGALLNCYAESVVAGVPGHVAQRELDTVSDMLGWRDGQLRHRGLPADQGPGNALLLTLEYASVTEVITAFGDKAVSAETVAKRAVEAARGYQSRTSPVGEYLADQLLLPMALAGAGEMTVIGMSLHARTNVEVIEQFLEVKIRVTELESGCHVKIA